MWKGQGSFECAGFNAGAVGTRDRIYILGGDYSPDEITDDVQVTHRNSVVHRSHVCILGFIFIERCLSVFEMLSCVKQ